MQAAKNLPVDLAALLDKLVKCEGEALLARWMVKNRISLIAACQKQDGSKTLDAPRHAASVIAELAKRLLGTAK